MQVDEVPYSEKLREASEFLLRESGIKAGTGIILGSGLGRLMDDVEIIKSFPYGNIPFFPISTVEGHSGELVIGKLEGEVFWFMNGRFHYYEGYEMAEVVFPLRVLHYLGVSKLIVTNAAGGLNPDFEVGDLMVIQDIINLFPGNPLRGKNIDALGLRFPDMSEPLDSEWMNLVEREAEKLQIKLRKGVYVGVPGPKLESRAEVKYLRLIGGDAVGMSTVPEIIAAHHMEMRVLAISVITNESIPKDKKGFSHGDVVEVANKAGQKLMRLIKSVLTRKPE